MRQTDEGWRSVGDKHTCARCLPEKAIAAFIRETASSNSCSYCGRRSRKAIAAEMDEVLSFIAQGLRRENEDPANSVGYDSSEGGYLLPTQDGDEILSDYGLDDCHAKLWDDLVEAFGETQWVKHDPYGVPRDEQRVLTWSRFSEQVRHRTRFVFFQVKTNFASEIGGPMDTEPHAVLAQLARAARDLDLLCIMPLNTRILRARQHKPSETPTGVLGIGPPPADDCTQQNRFSPAGIPMFYGTEKKATALLETASSDRKRTMVTIGTFRTRRELLLLDLSNLPEYPSVFDPERSHHRVAIAFLRHFTSEARNPVSSPGRESFEYVPTQVVAEYFRHVFTTGYGGSLDGIKYRSSKDEGICYTLFMTAADCGGRGETGKDLILTKLSTKTV